MIGLIGWGRFFRDGQKIAAPADLWNFLRKNANEISQSFDIVQLPPASLTQSGTDATGDGYGVIQRRMLDGTLYGNTEGLMAAVAALRARGVKVSADLVLHQFAAISTSYPHGGRGAQTPGWIRGHQSWNEEKKGWNDPIPPYCQADDVPVPSADFSFGAEVSYQHCHPAGVTEADAIDYLKWLSARIDVTDFRFDDTKGTYAPAVRRIMDAVPHADFYSEYFDGNPANLNWWATSAPMNGRSAVQDFTLHFALQNACNGFDATQLSQGYWQWNSGLSVGFVDNPDTDTSPGQQIIFNKGIAYAIMLNLPARMSLVYLKDYLPDSVIPGAYGLKPIIDNLCWIARTFAFGAFQRQWIDKDVYCFTRDGQGGSAGWSGGLVVACNFNVLQSRTITVGTPFGPNHHIHDYSGHAPDVWTDMWGNATITIPSNAYSAGTSFVCYAPAGVNHSVAMTPLRTTQVFEGAHDLDVPVIKNGIQVLPQRIHCAGAATCFIEADFNKSAWSENTTVLVKVIHPNGVDYDYLTVSLFIASHKLLVGARQSGWYTIQLTAKGLPEAGSPFRLAVTYTGAE